MNNSKDKNTGKVAETSKQPKIDNATVIPAKKKLVKTMMLEKVVHPSSEKGKKVHPHNK